MNTHTSSSEENFWKSMTDIMSVLMMIFLLISVSYMLKIQNEKKSIEGVAISYQKFRDSLYQELESKFSKNLVEWNATMDKSSMTIRFSREEALFDKGSAVLKNSFKSILDDFFPKYLALLTKQEYRDHILEIRIEGHTSSEWSKGVSETEAYFQNMKLSQDRTRNTLKYILNKYTTPSNEEWLTKKLTANGMSSSRPILNEKHQEDFEKSRRVEFVIKTDAERSLKKIINLDEQE